MTSQAPAATARQPLFLRIRPGTLAEIDRAVRDHGLTRSGVVDEWARVAGNTRLNTGEFVRWLAAQPCESTDPCGTCLPCRARDVAAAE